MKIKLTVIAIFALSAGAFHVRPGQSQTKVKTAGEVYKNIKVLNDLPADQLINVMQFFNGSLGVNCNFCHVPNEWAKDDKEEKGAARNMIKMTLGINKDNFDGRLEVSCATCHNGRSHPAGMPVMDNIAARPAFDPKSRPALPTIDEVLEKYVTALGGKAAVEKVTSYSIKGTRNDGDGTLVPEEIFVKSADKLLVTIAYPNRPFASGLSGTSVWTTDHAGITDMRSIDAVQFRRDAQYFQPLGIRSIYKDMSVVATDKINDKPVYAVRAVTADGGRERLYFDVANGLLVRRSSSTPIYIGNFSTSVDYDDYRDVGGIKFPYSIKWSAPAHSSSLKVTEVKPNAAIEDARFARPAK